ncbi:hypothetical protein B0H34DRAFT_334982 [Crassisporium funariophilum]|nr:hypothetical protein B0H34DRAFT_334982 [Crassisporium funariophilum]
MIFLESGVDEQELMKSPVTSKQNSVRSTCSILNSTEALLMSRQTVLSLLRRLGRAYRVPLEDCRIGMKNRQRMCQERNKGVCCSSVLGNNPSWHSICNRMHSPSCNQGRETAATKPFSPSGTFRTLQPAPYKPRVQRCVSIEVIPYVLREA